MNATPESAQSVAPSTSLADLIDELTNRLQAGESIDSAAIQAAHPEDAERLKHLIPALRAAAALGFSVDAEGKPVSPSVNSELGDFRIIHELGRGGMGIVYEAEQTSLNRRVALKVLPFAATMDPRQMQRFRNEALAAASLRHEHIVHVYGVGCERGVHYYAMELIEGQTLAEVIGAFRSADGSPGLSSGATFGRPSGPQENLSPEGDGCVAPGEALRTRGTETKPNALLSTRRDKQHFRHIAELIAQAADALEYAHSMGVVHRDIKPGNLMLDNGGHLWVTDFGLAKSLSPDVHGGAITMTGDVIGTLRYMSPEQALAKHGLVDHRTDVYSLGATLYELLTLKPAVQGDDKQELLKHIAFEEPTPLRKLDKAIPAELETITLKALAKEPGERYVSAGELAEDLRRWLGDKAIKARPPGVREQVAKWGRRHRGLVRASLAMAFVLVIGMGLSMYLLAKAWETSEGHRIAAEEQSAMLRKRVYAADLRRAHELWKRGVLDDVNAILDEFVPQPGGEDLRGFEWYYLKNLANTQPRHVHTFSAKFGAVYAAVFSPDGRYVATTGQQSVIQLWDSHTYQLVYQFEGHVDDCNSLAFTPDSRWLVSCGDDCSIRIWDVENRRPVGALPGHTDSIQKVAFSRDGQWLASAACDSTVRVWDFEKRKLRSVLRGGGDWIYSAAFSPSGETLASNAGRDHNPLTLNHLKTNQPHSAALERSPENVVHCVYSENDKYFAAATRSDGVMVWNSRNLRLLHALEPKLVTYRFLAFSRDEKRIHACADDGRVRTWSTADGCLLNQFRIHEDVDYPQARSWGVALSLDERLLLTASGAARADLWELPTCEPRYESTLDSSGWPIVLGAQTPIVAFDGFESSGILAYGMHDGDRSLVRRDNPHRRDGAVGLCCLSPTEHQLAVWAPPRHDAENPIELWDLKSRRLIDSAPMLPVLNPSRARAAGNYRQPETLVMAHDNSLYTVTLDGELFEWDRNARCWRHHPGVPSGHFHTSAATPDGRIIVFTGDREWRIWDAERRAWLAGGQTRIQIRAACLSANGQILAICDYEGSIRMIDVLSGRERKTVIAHQHHVENNGLAFNADGRTIATASRGVVRLWHVATGEELFSLEISSTAESRHALRFRDDGSVLVAATPSNQGTRIVVWDATARTSKNVDAARAPLRIRRTPIPNGLVGR